MKKTPFYDLHVEHNGKMVEFAGYYLPIQYEKGLIAEHLAVRNSVGLFDVSHMGEIEITGPNAIDTVQNLITNDVSKMSYGSIIYTLMCYKNGTVVDDLLVYKFSDENFLLVVNASNIEKDFTWIKQSLIGTTVANNKSESIAQLALQGPRAAELLEKLIGEDNIPQRYYTFTQTDKLYASDALISRTGYTGEDGFELYFDKKFAAQIFNDIYDNGKEFGLSLCGLGCRDTLRLEAGFPLYGHELSDMILANEVNLGFCIKMNKLLFIGKDMLTQLTPHYCCIGFKIVDKGIAREGALVYQNNKEVGIVTSGTFSPSLGYGIGMARIKKEVQGDDFEIDVRGKRLKAIRQSTPFISKKTKK